MIIISIIYCESENEGEKRMESVFHGSKCYRVFDLTNHDIIK